MIEIVPSPRESARFGLRIGRASFANFNAADVVAALKREPLDVAILRLPSRSIDAVDDLRRYGLIPIIADTLVRYEIDLRSREPSEDRQDLILRSASLNDAQLLEAMTREIFAGYVSHYHANPLFEPDKILDGYAEWAASQVNPSDDSAGTWIVERGADIVGFSCYHLNTKDGLATGVLNGIMPSARGQGNYRAMLRRMLDHFTKLGMRRFSIATQDHNMAVQRTWTTEGLTLCEVNHTVHINVHPAAGAFMENQARRADSSR